MLSSWAFLDLIVILAFIFIEFVAKQIGIILQAKIDIILQASRECSNGNKVRIKITHFTLQISPSFNRNYLLSCRPKSLISTAPF